MDLVKISRQLSAKADKLRFAAPVAYTYNPLSYAREPHELYLSRFGRHKKEILFLGMNPGPFGMAQTGVPFGDVALVRDWLGVRGKVKKPRSEHPKRLILGFDCPRSEVSGSRLWGWAKARYRKPERFFERFFIANYCPLCFMEQSGKNRTPDKLPKAEQAALFSACDEALNRIVDELKPKYVIGVGGFAEKRAQHALAERKLTISDILHPSPANPRANRDWAGTIESQLRDLGIRL